MQKYKGKILVIDDEDVILDACKLVLKKEKYKIWTAKDGEKGLFKTKKFKPDIILLDLKMPGMNGIEVLKKLKEIDEKIVTIIITGYGTVNSAIETMKLGADDFLRKLFTPEQLRYAVRKGIEKKEISLKTLNLQKEQEIMRDNFIKIVSHEMKTPLFAIQQNLEVILSGMAGKIEGDVKKILERINMRLKGLMELINDWVDVLTYANSYKFVKKSEKVNLNELINNVVDLFRKKAEEKKVTLHINMSQNLPIIKGDSAKLEEVFINLLDNGIKYDKENGKVIIKTKQEKGYILISFSDTGIGIPKEELPLIFNEFFRISKEPNSNKKGVGLFISKRIIEAHSGSIEVSSKPDKGSTFTVLLPIENG